jgi:hypothetical protein
MGTKICNYSQRTNGGNVTIISTIGGYTQQAWVYIDIIIWYHNITLFHTFGLLTSFNHRLVPDGWFEE